MVSLRTVKNNVRRITGYALKEENETFKRDVIMLSSAVVGPIIRELIAFTGYDRAFVQETGRRCRDAGIWKRGKVDAEWFGENGGIAFCCDSLVVAGLLERRNG